MNQPRIHGGATDARWDFSTNANCLGSCPAALQAIAAADFSSYPDASYQALIAQLAQWHGVTAQRVILGASASELIMRFNVALRLLKPLESTSDHWRIAIPSPAYGDYAASALACGHMVCGHLLCGQTQGLQEDIADVTWLTLPSSPLGQLAAVPATPQNALQVVDCAYLPLQLSGVPVNTTSLNNAWQIWSPNKALGLCGVRAAYAIAPQPAPQPALYVTTALIGGQSFEKSSQLASLAGLVDTLRSLEPSWVLGAASVAMLQAWTTQPVQNWLATSRDQLRRLKAAQIAQLQHLQIAVQPSVTNFMCIQLHTQPAEHTQRLWALRQHGIALRDTTSMGLPGWARMRVHTPEALDAFTQVWTHL